MKKLFWGFFFVYLNFNLNLNAHSINLLPNFVGWWLVLQGMEELKHESRYFENPRPFVLVLMVYEAILWLGNALAVVGESWLTMLLGILGGAAALYVIWLLVKGVRETEENHAADLGSAVLHRRWKNLLILQVAVRLLGIMGNLSNISILAVVSIVLVIAGFVVMVQFLMDWHRTAKAYEALGERVTNEEKTEE